MEEATDSDYVNVAQGLEAPDRQKLLADKVREAILTSQLTLAGQSTGANPYNSCCGQDRQLAKVPPWTLRRR